MMDSKRRAELKASLLKLSFGKYHDEWVNAHDDRYLVHSIYNQLMDALEAMKDVSNHFVWCAFNREFITEWNEMAEIVGRFTGQVIKRREYLLTNAPIKEETK